MSGPVTGLDAWRERLVARRRELERRLHRIEHDLDERPDPDGEERATEREDDEVLEDLGRAGLRELRLIDMALERLREGSFGICAGCGEAIDPRRLDLLPHAARCRHCA